MSGAIPVSAAVTLTGRPWLVVGGAVLVVLAVLLAIVALVYGKLWFQAFMSSARVGIVELIGMTFRQVNARLIVQAKIMAMQSGIGSEKEMGISTRRLEAHYLAGGNVNAVVVALISADKAGIPLTFERAASIDLAGRDVLEAVQMSVNPKVITTPMVAAVAKDGIQVTATSRVTVRANIERLVGGAGEETIVARVGEGIVTTIGSAETHKQVLENPHQISQRVLAKGLDAGTAFEILSIDIADVEVGENIGAKLQEHQAEADLKIARAKAEERRAMAVAQEQEMRARVQEMSAKVREAEAEVPLALAAAFRTGSLGRLD